MKRLPTYKELEAENARLVKIINCEHDQCTTKWFGDPDTGGPDRISTCDDCGKVMEDLI